MAAGGLHMYMRPAAPGPQEPGRRHTRALRCTHPPRTHCCLIGALKVVGGV